MATQKAVVGKGIRASHSKGLCPAVLAGDFIFMRGETGRDPATGKVVSADIKEQTRQVLSNIGGMLEAAGGTLNDIVSATVYLRNLDDFKAFNEVWSEAFQNATPGPARATVGVARLGEGVLVEIQSIAYLK